MITGIAIFSRTELDLLYIWNQATFEGKAIIIILVLFSIIAWSIMATKAVEMRQARKLNGYFDAEFRNQKVVFGIFDRRVHVDGCPLFAVYQAGCQELDTRLRDREGNRRPRVSLTAMEHVKRTLERCVAQQSLKLESAHPARHRGEWRTVPRPARYGLGRHERVQRGGQGGGVRGAPICPRWPLAWRLP
jgi:hypothetical protein